MTLAIEFNVQPVPAIKMTERQYKLCRIPDHKLTTDKLVLKRRIERYQNYKSALGFITNSKKFILPGSGTKILFYIETKEQERWGKPHQMKPDTDNLVKGLKDGICRTDQHIWNYELEKRWCPIGKGRVEIWLKQ